MTALLSKSEVSLTVSKCYSAFLKFDRVQLMSWQLQKLHEGQPVDAAERDRVLRLPITLPSNYLRTAIQHFQVSCVRRMPAEYLVHAWQSQKGMGNRSRT